MKNLKIALPFVLGVFPVLLTGCSDPASMIAESPLPNHEEVTIGNLWESYEDLCSNGEWSDFENNQGTVIAQYQCDLNLAEALYAYELFSDVREIRKNEESVRAFLQPIADELQGKVKIVAQYPISAEGDYFYVGPVFATYQDKTIKEIFNPKMMENKLFMEMASIPSAGIYYNMDSAYRYPLEHKVFFTPMALSNDEAWNNALKVAYTKAMKDRVQSLLDGAELCAYEDYYLKDAVGYENYNKLKEAENAGQNVNLNQRLVVFFNAPELEMDDDNCTMEVTLNAFMVDKNEYSKLRSQYEDQPQALQEAIAQNGYKSIYSKEVPLIYIPHDKRFRSSFIFYEENASTSDYSGQITTEISLYVGKNNFKFKGNYRKSPEEQLQEIVINHCLGKI